MLPDGSAVQGRKIWKVKNTRAAKKIWPLRKTKEKKGVGFGFAKGSWCHLSTFFHTRHSSTPKDVCRFRDAPRDGSTKHMEKKWWNSGIVGTRLISPLENAFLWILWGGKNMKKFRLLKLRTDSFSLEIIRRPFGTLCAPMSNEINKVLMRKAFN